MANSKIFCNVPWTNTHLYWSGEYGMCCSEIKQSQNPNIQNTSLVNWYNSSEMRQFRQRILGDVPLPECTRCYNEEKHGHESRRIKENFKSAIFTTQAFDRSYKQSPWYETFESSKPTGATSQLPRDWHIDFGNECNLACKMCMPAASSRIAQHYRKWDIPFDQKPNWTNDEKSWQQFLTNIRDMPHIHRIHVMGGEPTINKRFYEFICWLVDNNLTDISISFVTNGTTINHSLIDKLKKFSSVDIEVSIESFNKHVNQYIRQGSNTLDIIKNIEYLLSLQSDTLHIVLRSVPQLLNIHTYHQYIEFAFNNNVSIQSIPLINPRYLAINVLPWEVRQKLIINFNETKNKILSSAITTFSTITTGRDTSRLDQQLAKECDAMISILSQPAPMDVDFLRKELMSWLMKWDHEYKLNAFDIYPEYHTFLSTYGYNI